MTVNVGQKEGGIKNDQPVFDQTNDEEDDSVQEKKKAEWDPTKIENWIKKEHEQETWGTEEHWDKVKSFELENRSIGDFRTCVTISSTEERACAICGMTKVPF